MIELRPFTVADVPLGMALKTAAGWNQTEADWYRALELEPAGCFVGRCDGTDAATLTTVVFGNTAWVAMVLTQPDFRGRGLATALLNHALKWLQSRGVDSVRLDATDAGRPVYERLGFRVVGRVERNFGVPNVDEAGVPDPNACIVPLSVDRLPEAAAIDAAAFGNDRTKLLRSLHRDWPTACHAFITDGVLQGFITARRGSRATQWGPCVAKTDEAGDALLRFALASPPAVQQEIGPAYLDVPNGNVAAHRIAIEVGLRRERNFHRMTWGRDVAENDAMIWSTFGPEKG